MVTNVYDFENKVLVSKKDHGAGGGRSTTVVNRFAYDVGRFTDLFQSNNNASSDQLVARYEYNELGQLVDKKLHDTGGENFLQSIDYRYNIRGQSTIGS